MLVGLGGTAGGVIFPLLNSYLITTFGWREAFRFLAGGLWLIYIPITLIFLVNRPEDVGMLPDNMGHPQDDTDPNISENDELSFQQFQAVRTSSFWIIAFCIFQSSLVGTGVVLHFVSIFENQGFSMSSAAIIMGAKPLISLITTIIAGLFLDKISHHQYVLAVAYGLQVVGYGLLAFMNSIPISYLYALISGIAGGVAIISIGVLIPNLFGRRYLGGIFGVLIALNVIGSAIGPIIFGAAFDWIHGYREIILLSALLPFLSGVLCLFIRKPVLKATT